MYRQLCFRVRGRSPRIASAHAFDAQFECELETYGGQNMGKTVGEMDGAYRLCKDPALDVAGCLVYSFGVGRGVRFELDMANRTACEVLALDKDERAVGLMTRRFGWLRSVRSRFCGAEASKTRTFPMQWPFQPCYVRKSFLTDKKC